MFERTFLLHLSVKNRHFDNLSVFFIFESKLGIFIRWLCEIGSSTIETNLRRILDQTKIENNFFSKQAVCSVSQKSEIQEKQLHYGNVL